MNKIILTGRLTKDPDVKYTNSGKNVTNFTLAVDRVFAGKDKEKETDFINIVTWNKTAEFCGNYLNKGSKILVEGRLQIRSYEDKDGQKKYVTEVVAESVENLTTKAEQQKGNTPTNTDVKKITDSFGEDMIGTEVPF